MSAPPLPDIFGNYTLGDDFVEVVSPAGVDWLPQTAAWGWVGAILALLLLRWAWRRLRRWYRNRYRREARAHLEKLARAAADEHWLVQLNSLLKRTALAGFSRQEVARLSGADWIEFLNARCAAAPFSGDAARMLANGVYTRATPDESSRRQLVEAAQCWIDGHEGSADV